MEKKKNADPNVLTNIFRASLKKKIYMGIYMGIIYMSFLSRNLLCKNIDTMLSFMWSNELFSILKCYTSIEFFV